MQLHNPIFSFLQFDGSFDPIPIKEEEDLKFQVLFNCDDAVEAATLVGNGCTIRLANTGTTPDQDSVAANTLINFAAVDASFVPALIRFGDTKVLLYWEKGLPGFKDIVPVGGCFTLVLEVPDSPTLFYVSNPLFRIGDDYLSSVLEYSCDENAYGFVYCDLFVPNRVRLPIHLRRPQFQDEDSVYVRSGGMRKLLKSVTKKEYLGVTDYLSESWHDRIKYALSHDHVYIESKRYQGGIVKNGNYEVEWPEFMDVEEGIGTFKILATPYDWRNSNCAECSTFEEANCELVISDVVITDMGQQTRHHVYKAEWTNSATPYAITAYYYPSGGTSWLPVPLISNQTANSMVYSTGPGPEQEHLIKIVPMCSNKREGTFGIGEYEITPITSCQSPSGLSFSDITADSVLVEWPPVVPNPIFAYDWELYDGSGLVKQGNHNMPGGTIYLYLTSLQSGTSYTIKVRAHCDMDLYSDWVTGNFQTL